MFYLIIVFLVLIVLRSLWKRDKTLTPMGLLAIILFGVIICSLVQNSFLRVDDRVKLNTFYLCEQTVNEDDEDDEQDYYIIDNGDNYIVSYMDNNELRQQEIPKDRIDKVLYETTNTPLLIEYEVSYKIPNDKLFNILFFKNPENDSIYSYQYNIIIPPGSVFKGDGEII